jgi:hypothetical protein
MRKLVLALVLLPIGNLLAADLPPAEGPLTIKNGAAFLSGKALLCSKANSTKWVDDDVTDVGKVDWDESIIQLNIHEFQTISPDAARFVFHHECGHLIWPHHSEEAIDCNTMAKGLKENWFRPSVLPELCDLSDPFRCIYLYQCYGNLVDVSLHIPADIPHK